MSTWIQWASLPRKSLSVSLRSTPLPQAGEEKHIFARLRERWQRAALTEREFYFPIASMILIHDLIPRAKLDTLYFSFGL